MKSQPFFLACVLAGFAMAGGCKKADDTASTASPTQPASPAPRPQTVAARSKAGAAGDNEPVTFKAKWPVGARYVYRMDMDQRSTNRLPMLQKPMEQTVTMSMTYAVSVPKELPDNGRQLDMEFLANEMEVKMGEQVLMSFDSKEAGASDTQNPMLAPFRKMIGSKLGFEVNADGRVGKAVNLDDWYKSLGRDGDQGKAMLSSQFNEGFFRQMFDFARAFPDKPVRPGDTWPFQVDVPAGPGSTIKVNAKITFTGWENRQDHRCARLSSVGTFEAPDGIQAGNMGKMTLEQGKMNGVSWFDPELGALIATESNQTMHMAGNVPGMPAAPKGAPGLAIELGQKISSTLAEQGKIQ